MRFIWVVSNLTTRAFLLAFKRFVARRGVCKIVYSDNAKTFQSADRELQKVWKTVRSAEAQDFYGTQGIAWKFIVERAAWWGGFWERLIRILKDHLKKTLGRALLNFEELTTVVAEIEAVMNSRPITEVNDDIQCIKPLTPAHFLVGEKVIELPKGVADLTTESTRPGLQRRWQYRQRLLDSFWSRWRWDYLLTLRNAHNRRNLQEET